MRRDLQTIPIGLPLPANLAATLRAGFRSLMDAERVLMNAGWGYTSPFFTLTLTSAHRSVLTNVTETAFFLLCSPNVTNTLNPRGLPGIRASVNATRSA